jgi:hypothetical protein
VHVWLDVPGLPHGHTQGNPGSVGVGDPVAAEAVLVELAEIFDAQRGERLAKSDEGGVQNASVFARHLALQSKDTTRRY